MAVTALWVDFEQLQLICQRLGVQRCAFTGAAADHAWRSRSSVRAGTRACQPLFQTATPCGAGSARRNVTVTLLVAAQVLVILIVASFFHKAPEFVYKAF